MRTGCCRPAARSTLWCQLEAIAYLLCCVLHAGGDEEESHQEAWEVADEDEIVSGDTAVHSPSHTVGCYQRKRQRVELLRGATKGRERHAWSPLGTATATRSGEALWQPDNVTRITQCKYALPL